MNDAIKLMSSTAAETEASLSNVTTALLNLSTEQVVATTSSMGLSAAQTATAMAAKSMSAAEIASELAIRGFSKSTAEAALIQAGFTPEVAASTVAQYSFAAAEGTATAATNAFTTSIGAAVKGMLTFLATNPVGWAIAATAAIFVLVKAYEAFNESFDDAVAKAEESRQAYEEQKSKVSSLNSELETTSQRLEELDSKESLTIVEQEELDNLRTTNDLLKEQLEIEQAIENMKLQTARDDAVNVLSKRDFVVYDDPKYNGQSAFEQKLSTSAAASRHGYTPPQQHSADVIEYAIARQEYLNSITEERNDIIKKQNALLDKNGKPTDEKAFNDYGNKIQSINDEIKSLTDEITEYWGTISEQEKYLFDANGNVIEGQEERVKLIAQLRDLIVEYATGVSQSTKNKQNKIDSFLDRPTLEKDVAAAKAAAKELDGITFEQLKQKFPELAREIEQMASQTDISIEDVINTINSLASEVNTQNVSKEIENMKSKIRDSFAKSDDWLGSGVASGWLNTLTDDEIEILYKIVESNDTSAWSIEDWELAITEAIESSQESLDGLETSFSSLRESASGFIKEISNIQSALNSQSNGISISLESLSVDGMSDYQSALEYVNGTMQLNAEKCREIAQAKAEEQIATVEANKAMSQGKYLENAKQIERYREKIRKANFENGETAESVQNNINTLLDENSTLAITCKQYDLLSSSIKEAIGSYQNWMNAQNASDYGDMANDAVNAIERIRETFDSESDIFGNFGSKKFDAAVEFIVPDSVSHDDIGAIESYMESFKQYIRFDDNGNADGLNIDTFLSNAVQAGLMNYSEDNGWTIAGQKSMEDFAQGLNMSSGLVQAFFDELQLKGAEFDWSDEAIKTFGDLAVEANEAAEALRNIEGNENLRIKLDVSNLKTTEEQLNSLDTTISEMNTVKGKVNVDSSEIDYANSVIQYCVSQKQLLSQPEIMRVDTTQCTEDVANVLSLLQRFQQAQNQLEIVQSVGADTTDAQAEVDSLISDIESLSPEVKTRLGIDSTSADAIQESINNINAEALVKFGVDETAITGYNPKEKSCEVIYNPNTDLLPKSFDPMSRIVEYKPDTSLLPERFNTLTRTVRYVATGATKLDGTAHMNGSTHNSGTALAGGDWGTAPGGSTLVGELGREIVVDPRTGQWYTVGDNGAEFVNIPEGAIVFNHKQTESLLENGYVSGRASALVSGTAMVTGGYKPYVSKPSGSTTSNNNNISNSAAATVPVTVKPTVDNKTLEEQLEETLKKMKEKIDDVIGNFEHEIFIKEKNGASADKIISIYKAMQKYVHEQANAYRKLGLDENSDYIQELQKQWWEYEESIREARISAYEKVIDEHENAIKLNENWLEKSIDRNDRSGVLKYSTEIVNHYKAAQEELHKLAEYYRSLGYSDTSDEVSALMDKWWEYYDEIKSVAANAWQEILDNAHEAVDEIVNLYDTMKTAAKEYESSGFITIKTFQELAKLGVENLAYLQDENGLLVINKENIEKVIAARTQQMAVETALNYVQQIRSALTEGNITELSRLTLATQIASNSTWDLVYAQLQLAKSEGLSDDMFMGAINNINNLRALTDITVVGIGKVEGGIDETRKKANEAITEQSEALKDILKYVEEMIKQEIKNQIEAIDAQIDKMKEIVDLQKKSLDLEKEKDKYSRTVAEKTKEMAKIQQQLALLELDDSRKSLAKQAQLREKLATLSNDLADEQSDHATETTKASLDDMLSAYKTEKENEIAVLEDSISSEEKLYQLAIERIQTQWGTLYNDLLEWNTQYGTVTNEEITSAWNSASEAVKTYGSYLNAVLETQKQIAAYKVSTNISTSTTTGTPVQDNSSNVVGVTGEYDTSGGKEMEKVHNIIRKMYANSQAWRKASPEERKRLEAENLKLGTQDLLRYGIVAYRQNGTWYNNDGTLFFERYKNYIYHEGGITGNDPTLKQEEMYAKVKKGELILNDKQQEGLFHILDVQETMLSKYGKLLGSVSSSDLMKTRIQDQLKRQMNQAQTAMSGRGDIINNNITIPLQVLQHLSESEINSLTDKVSKRTIDELDGVFALRGKRSLRH